MVVRRPAVVIALVLAAPLLMGHGDGGCGCGDDEAGIAFGPPTGALCPPGGTTITYDGFAQGFMAAYCLRCHSSEVTGADRGGAPSDHNFDSHFEIAAFSDHIDWMAGAGPDALNDQMPPDDGDAPTEAERRQLSEWLACGAPPPLQ